MKDVVPARGTRQDRGPGGSENGLRPADGRSDTSPAWREEPAASLTLRGWPLVRPILVAVAFEQHRRMTGLQREPDRRVPPFERLEMIGYDVRSVGVHAGKTGGFEQRRVDSPVVHIGVLRAQLADVRKHH